MWGQDAHEVACQACSRIIPTRVGTSKYERQLLSNAEDHPHACGDKTKEIKENSGFAKSTA